MKKTLFPHFVFLAALSFAGAASVRADSFQLNYQFTDSPDSIVMTFDGTANGDLISNLSNIEITFFQPPVPSAGLPAVLGPTQLEEEGPSTISFDDLEGGFVLMGGGYEVWVSGGPQNGKPFFSAFNQNSSDEAGGEDASINSSWSITRIPDASATVGLLGLGMLALYFCQNYLNARRTVGAR